MKKVLNVLIVFIPVLLTFLPIYALSSSPIDFSDSNTVNELVLNKTWACEMVDNYGESIGTWKFNSVKGNKEKEIKLKVLL